MITKFRAWRIKAHRGRILSAGINSGAFTWRDYLTDEHFESALMSAAKLSYETGCPLNEALVRYQEAHAWHQSQQRVRIVIKAVSSFGVSAVTAAAAFHEFSRRLRLFGEGVE